MMLFNDGNCDHLPSPLYLKKKKKRHNGVCLGDLLAWHKLGGSASSSGPYCAVVHTPPDELCDRRLDVAFTILGHISQRRYVSSGPFSSHCSIEMCKSMT